MKFVKYMGLLAATLSLTACNSVVGTNFVKADGSPKGELVWPDMEDASLPEGMFPNLENLGKIASGVTKKHLYYLIERPHFQETNGAKEWNYIMKFRQEDSSVKVCQYKVLFDKDEVARSFFWKPSNCLNEKFDLSADALFPFNRGGEGDIKVAGKEKLDALAARLVEEGNQAKLAIVGYTDYLGSDSYNLALSEQRAESVGQYLVNRGVDAANITTEGRGEASPVVKCENNGSKAALVRCLAPNRRVSIEITR